VGEDAGSTWLTPSPPSCKLVAVSPRPKPKNQRCGGGKVRDNVSYRRSEEMQQCSAHGNSKAGCVDRDISEAQMPHSFWIIGCVSQYDFGLAHVLPVEMEDRIYARQCSNATTISARPSPEARLETGSHISAKKYSPTALRRPNRIIRRVLTDLVSAPTGHPPFLLNQFFHFFLIDNSHAQFFRFTQL
jgi:hypothetical protein